MLRAVSTRVKAMAAATVLIVLGIGGCYWYRYADLMRTHLALLDAMAAKLCASNDGRGRARLSGPALAEYEYPLARARDFARVAQKRCPERGSLRAFGQVLSAYGRIVRDVARADGPGCALVPRLTGRIRRVDRWLTREPRSCR